MARTHFPIQVVLTLILVAQLGMCLTAQTVAKGSTTATSGEYCSSLDKPTCELPIGCQWSAALASCSRKPFVGKGSTMKSTDTNLPPQVPLPWTTTQQRTHTFTGTTEFLSIAEQQSQRMTADGMTQSAFSIFPATPFSMRDASNTIIQGMRGVFTTDASKGAGWVHKIIWLTNLTGHSYCYANVVANSTVETIIPAQPKHEIIRGNGDWGVPVERFVTYYQGKGTVTMDYVREARGGIYANGTGVEVQYPLRKTRDYDGVVPGERGYMLDLGQHFPVAIDRWFDMTDLSGCPSATFQPEVMTVGPDGVLELDHHKLLKRSTFQRK